LPVVNFIESGRLTVQKSIAIPLTTGDSAVFSSFKLAKILGHRVGDKLSLPSSPHVVTRL
jgi:hypothetical protein